MGPGEKRVISEAEYLATEAASPVKREYVNGEVVAMAGASPVHNAIASNLHIALGARLRGKPCRPYGSDLRIHVPDTGLYTYPDLSVVCGQMEFHPEDAMVVVNPRLLFEVLSPGTEAYDRGAKFGHYRHLASLAEYTLISQDIERVEHYVRAEGGAWILREYGLGDAVPLAALDIEITVDELYEGVAELRAQLAEHANQS